MTEIDTSMYNKAGPAPMNPLATMGQYQGIANAMMQNRLMHQELPILQQRQQQMEMETRQQRAGLVAHEILQKHQNPDSTYDYNSALAEMAEHPETAYAVPNMLQERAANNAQTQAGIDEQGRPLYQAQQSVASGFNPSTPKPQVDDIHNHLSDMQNTLNGLIKTPDLSLSDIYGAAGDLTTKFRESKGKMGVSPIEVAQELTNLPREDQNGNPPSPEVLRQYLQQHFNKAVAMQAAVTHKLGPPSSRMAQNPNQMGGINSPQGSEVQLQQPGEVNTPTKVMSQPPGFTTPLPKSRENYDEVVNMAKNAPTMNAAYEEAINLNKAGAPTGTTIANTYQWIAKNVPGVAQDIKDKAAQAQEIGKWMAQGLLANGMPGSDARLYELQHANLNPDQLPETIKELAPFFKAVSKGAIAKQNFYNQVTNNGTDLAKEPVALQQWTNNYDPRWLEFDELSGKKDRHEFLLKHPDLLEKRQHLEALQQMGVVGK